jgi:ESCRT-I complex subunit TSG101
VPLAVYLRDEHPESPPVCIIQPTPEMMIKPNHHHVDVQGLVYLPYLQ